MFDFLDGNDWGHSGGESVRTSSSSSTTTAANTSNLHRWPGIKRDKYRCREDIMYAMLCSCSVKPVSKSRLRYMAGILPHKLNDMLAEASAFDMIRIVTIDEKIHPDHTEFQKYVERRKRREQKMKQEQQEEYDNGNKKGIDEQADYTIYLINNLKDKRRWIRNRNMYYLTDKGRLYLKKCDYLYSLLGMKPPCYINANGNISNSSSDNNNDHNDASHNTSTSTSTSTSASSFTPSPSSKRGGSYFF